MNQDQNRRYSPQGSDQPREHREQPPYEQHRGGTSPGQHRGGPPPEERSRQPPMGGPQGQQGGRHGGQQGSPMQGQRPQQGQQPTSHGATGGQFEGPSGRMDQPQQRQPPQTGRGQQQPMGPPPGQQMGGGSQQMGGRSQQQTGGQQRGQTGQPPQQSMSGGSRQMGDRSQQMGAQPGGTMGMGGEMGPRQLPVEPVGAEDIAETDVVTAERGDPLTSLVEKMEQADVGTVVIAEDDRPVGIVTDRKIALAISERPDLSEMTAEDVMTENPQTVTAEMNVYEVIQTLGDSGIRRAPIVDDDGKLTGIVSVDDMLVLLATELDQLGEIVERQIDRF